jgi:hypothetical protein
MAGHIDPTWIPSTTDIAPARGTDIAQFARRKYDRGSSYLGLWQWSVANEAQPLKPRTNSTWKISTTIRSPGAAL